MSVGRPRTLDETKLSEIIALISNGCRVAEAARYVGCVPSTIHREAERNPEFQDRLHRATLNARLSPLRAMQTAVTTHWRAAAWMLERTRPDRFAPRPPKTLSSRQARTLADELVEIVREETRDPLVTAEIEKRIRAAVQAATGQRCDLRTSNADIRRAQQYFAAKDHFAAGEHAVGRIPQTADPTRGTTGGTPAVGSVPERPATRSRRPHADFTPPPDAKYPFLPPSPLPTPKNPPPPSARLQNP